MRQLLFILIGLMSSLLLVPFVAEGKDIKEGKLLKPQIEAKPLLKILSKRSSSRSFSSKALPEQVLSNLLWAACGVNRPEGYRTAPTAMNKQEIDIYIAIKEGLFLYDAKNHALKLILAQDIRELTGKQEFVKDAALNLIFVADKSKFDKNVSEKDKYIYIGADAAFISQNVYLFSAAEKLNTVVRAYIDKEKLSGVMQLKSGQEIIFSQTVGYPN